MPQEPSREQQRQTEEEIEALHSLRISFGWELVRRRTTETIQALVDDLLEENDAVQIHLLRGTILGMEALLNAPDAMIRDRKDEPEPERIPTRVRKRLYP